MGELNTINSYNIAIQQLQLNLIKQTVETQQQLIETLLDPECMIHLSNDKGSYLDINI